MLSMQIFTLILLTLALSPALAHALEYPGKLRLSKEEYARKQTIYYPGFTVAGAIGEVGGLIAAIVLTLITPRETAAFWFTLAAVLGLAGMTIIYWLRTHLANRYWLQAAGAMPGGVGGDFFSFGAGAGPDAGWQAMRDRWERSHIARAALAFVSFVSLLLAIAVGG